MKKFVSICIVATLLSGCDTGEKAIKGAAKAVLAEDTQQTQPVQAQQPVQVQQPVQAQQPAQVQQPVQAQQPVVNESLPAKSVPAAPRVAEKVVRHRAQVLTQYGGKVVVRNSPSQNGRKLGFLYDQEEVWVVGETDKCETINNIYGCWVKVMDSQRLVGYSFGGYLQY